MIRPVRRAILMALGLSLGTAALRPTHAQFGKFKKKAITTATAAAGVPTTPPTYVKSVTITGDQLKQLNTGLSAMVAKAPSAQKDYEQATKKLERETQDYEKARAEYDKKAASYNACVERVTGVETAKHDSMAARVDKSLEATQMNQSQEDQMTAMAEKAQAAAERVSNGTATAADRQTLADFQKMMAGVSANSQRAATAVREVSASDREAAAHLEKECGKEPAEPAPPAPAPSGPSDVLEQAGAAAAGTTVGWLARWIEEGEGYIRSNTVAQAGGGMTEQQAADFNSELKTTKDLLAQLQQAGFGY